MSSRGDTIIEVLLAFTVFCLIAVLGMNLMNKGTATAQRAMEITQVKQQVDAQVEALRAAQQDYFAKAGATTVTGNTPADSWKSIVDLSSSSTTVDSTCPAPGGDTFIMNPLKAVKEGTIKSVDDPSNISPQARVVVSGGAVTSYGIWIEKSDPIGGAGGSKAYDFRVRACWYGPGVNTPMQVQSVVRLFNTAVIGAAPVPSGGGGGIVPASPSFTAVAKNTSCGVSSIGGSWDNYFDTSNQCYPATSPESGYFCSNYSINLTPQSGGSFSAGRYRLTVKYQNHDFGNCSGPGPIASSGYTYQTNIRLNNTGAPIQSSSLPADGTEKQYVYNFDIPASGANTVNLEWVNDYWIPGTPQRDPNFQYNSITLEKAGV